MGTWIEFRCENRSEDSADGNGLAHCWSHDNNGPMGEAQDNRTSLLETMRELEQDAKDTGWKKFKLGWICPFCASLPNLTIE